MFKFFNIVWPGTFWEMLASHIRSVSRNFRFQLSRALATIDALGLNHYWRPLDIVNPSCNKKLQEVYPDYTLGWIGFAIGLTDNMYDFKLLSVFVFYSHKRHWLVLLASRHDDCLKGLIVGSCILLRVWRYKLCKHCVNLGA
jgi:hypothetical protein